MPRRRAPPRLYLDRKRGQWVIRDGGAFIRTGIAEADRKAAENRLAHYLGKNHEPECGPDPLIADVLLAYASEHLPHTRTAKNAAYHVGNLSAWWGTKRLADVTAKNCRTYAQGRTQAMARRDLETLRAAIGYWHREYGPLPSVPAVVLPLRSQPRQRWLTRSEAARLLFAARHTKHLARFILLGLYTGSRREAILSLTWDRLDLARGVMQRRAPGAAEIATKRTPPVRLGQRILAHLRRWKRLDDDRVSYVCHYGGRRVYRMHGAWPKAVTRAGLGKEVTPHVLRHTRATWLMQANVDPWEAAGHLGMSLAVLGRVYGHHHADWQKRAAEV